MPKKIGEIVNVFPPLNYSISETTGDIEIPLLVPKEQIIVSYIYPSSITHYSQVNTVIKSNEGIIKNVPVILERRSFLFFIVFGLAIIGILSTVLITYKSFL